MSEGIKKEKSDLSLSDQKLLKLILNSIPARVFWKDKDSEFLGCNQLFAEDIGHESPESVIGKTDYDVHKDKDEIDYFVSVDRRVMEQNQAELGIIEPLHKHSGEQIWLETNKVPLTDDEGRVMGVFGMYTDVTAKIQALDAIEEHARKLEMKNTELEQFAYIAAHDLQEPLQTVTSFVDLFEAEYGDSLDDTAKQYHRFIKDSALRMQKQVSGLLEYARIVDDYPREDVDCQELCEGICLDFKSLIKETGARVRIDGLPVIKTGRVQIASIFQNLISNALKFTKEGVTPEIEVICTRSPEFWEFSVKDNGIGIEEEFSDKIFIIYQRLHNRADYEGSGIGLAHCKKTVAVLGGRIDLISKLGEGSTFHFTIAR